MPNTIGSHAVSTFTSPNNGDALDAGIVRGNDNTLRSAYVNHDNDPGIHIQSSELAARPGPGTAGRKWMTTDAGDVRLWHDTGTAWEEVDYVRAGGSVTFSDITATGSVTVTAALAVEGNVTLGNANTDTVAINGELTTNLVPDVNNAVDLGASGKAFRELFAQRATLNTVGYTFPSSQGANNAVLTNNGTGGLAWVIPPSGALSDATITPTTAAPHEVVVGNVTQRLVMAATAAPGTVTFSTANTNAMPNGTRVGLLALNERLYLGMAGAPDPAYAATGTVNGTPQHGVIQSDGRIIVVGSFTSYLGATRNNIARVNADWTLDTYDPNVNAAINVVRLQSDGRAIIAGQFGIVGGVGRTFIARLNTDGTLDTTFNAGVITGFQISDIAIQSDGSIVFVGNFSNVAGTARNNIARVNSTGVLDAGYNPSITGGVPRCIRLQADGQAIVGGDFTTVSGTARLGIARISTTGVLDAGYNPVFGGGSGSVNSLVVQSDGRAIIAGSFTQVNGANFANIARLNTNGTTDTAWGPGTGLAMSSATSSSPGGHSGLFIASDGRLYVASASATQGGVTRVGVVRLNSDGSLDPYFRFPTASSFWLSIVGELSNGRVVFPVQQYTTIGTAALRGLMPLYAVGTDGLLLPYSITSTVENVLARGTNVVVEKVANGQWILASSNANNA